jgi:hypothetical protein
MATEIGHLEILLATVAAAAAPARKLMLLLLSPSIASFPEVNSEIEKARDASAEDRTPGWTTLKVRMACCTTPDHIDVDEAVVRHAEVVYKEVEPRMPGWLDLEFDAGRGGGGLLYYPPL